MGVYSDSSSLKKAKTDLSVAYFDHNTVQIGFENSDDHIYLQGETNEFRVVYSRTGNGICHQVHLERFGKPGTTLLGNDSHTTTGGGVGQIRNLKESRWIKIVSALVPIYPSGI